MFSDFHSEYKKNKIYQELHSADQFDKATFKSNWNDFINNYSVLQNYIPSTGNDIRYFNKGYKIENKRCLDEIFTNNKSVSLLNRKLEENEKLLLKSEKRKRNKLENEIVSKESLKQYVLKAFYPIPANNTGKSISSDSIVNNAHEPEIGIKVRDLGSEIPTLYSNPEGMNYGIKKNKSAPTYRKLLYVTQFAKINVDQFHSTNQGQYVDNKIPEIKILTFKDKTKLKFNTENLNETAISSKNCEEKNLLSISKSDLHFGASLQKEPLICSRCNTDFDEHVIMHKKFKFYKCCTCKYKSLHRKYFMRHIKVHGVRPFCCTKCDEKFHGKGSHESDVTCKVCQENFPCKTLLLEHFIVHKEYCTLCGKGILLHSLNQKKQVLKCCFCKYTINERNHLWDHFLTHFREKAYKCEECGKRFTKKYNLKVHIQKHVTKIKQNVNHLK